MLEIFKGFQNTNFMPHGHCYFWDPAIMWTHAISDGIIALAYFIIPISLITIVRRRKDFSYTWMLVLFAIFIWGCGATHVLDVINIWEPWYRLDSAMRVITALASVGTAIMLLKITPQLILFPSATKWKAMNEELQLLNEDLERKVEERTLGYQEIAAKFEFLTDSIPQLVWTANANGEVTYLNKAWYSKVFQQAVAASEFSWQAAIHPEDRQYAEQEMDKATRAQEPIEMEVRLLSAGGNYRWHLLRALPMKDDAGQVNHWLGTATDMHDHKLAQEKLIKAKEDLQKSNMELNRINTDLDSFIYTASHDLRSPITNIEGIMTLLSKETANKLEGKEQRLMSMMGTSVLRLKSTIDDLTEVTKAQKEIDAEPEFTLFAKVTEDVKENLMDLIISTQAEIIEDFEVDVIFYPRKHLRSIILNLLSNALKYRQPQLRPLITLRSYRLNGQLVFSISDNGLGLTDQQQAKLFTMFRRMHAHIEGTGIGLYMIKRIIENKGGQIHVKSAVGEGSTFTVYFGQEENVVQ